MNLVTDLTDKILIIEHILKMVSECPNCPNCKTIAKQYFEAHKEMNNLEVNNVTNIKVPK